MSRLELRSDLPMLPAERLRDKLITMNNKNMQVYQELVGAYRFDRFVLSLDAIPPDPIVAPAQARVRIDQAEAQVPPALLASPGGRLAVQDFLARVVHDAIRRHVRTRWSGRMPPLAVDVGGQEVLARSSCVVAEEYIEVRLAVGLPAENRKVLAKPAQGLFFDELPAVVNAGLVWANLDRESAGRHVTAVEEYMAVRDALASYGLVAFVADGAMLAREPGPADGPMRGGRAIAFRAPDDLAVTITLPHRAPVRGLGIRQGVTVIAGGGFQGKSTVIRAIGRGVYPHVPGDGRELVAAVPDAVTIRAEPGRRIERVDVSAFVREVPQRFDVTGLSMEHATGPVSTAAAIAEALEIGTRLLLFDEDECAAAFLARDALMQQLVPKSREPVARLLDVVRALWEIHGVSSIVATSGLGDYVDVADTVVVMEECRPVAATERARTLVAARGDRRTPEGQAFSLPVPRCPQPRGFGGLRGRRTWAEVRGRALLNVGRETIELALLAQVVDPGQARAAGDAILYALEKGYVDGTASIIEALDRVFADIETSGFPVLALQHGQPADYALPRRHEVAAIMNRMRSFQARPRRAGAAAPEEPAPPDTVVTTPPAAATEAGTIVAETAESIAGEVPPAGPQEGEDVAPTEKDDTTGR